MIHYLVSILLIFSGLPAETGKLPPASLLSTAEVEILRQCPDEELLKRLLWMSWCQGRWVTDRVGDSTRGGYGCADAVQTLTGLLRAFGFASRHVGLYNVPGQGNHSLLEAETSTGRRFLFDPTFGVFFAPEGDPSGVPLDLERVTGHPRPVELKLLCCQAVASDPCQESAALDLWSHAVTMPIAGLFRGGRFDGCYFSVEDYARSERAAVDDQAAILPLGIPVNIRNGHGQFGVPENLPLGSREILLYNRLNQRLCSEDREDDVSLVATRFGLQGRVSLPFMHLEGLIPGRSYSLTLHVYNPGEEFRLDVIPLEGGVTCYPGDPLQISAGEDVSKQVIGLRARAEEARVLLHTLEMPSPAARLFGIEVDEITLEENR